MYMELWETGESKLRLKRKELAKYLCLQIKENPQTEILLEKKRVVKGRRESSQ